ncbi:MAG: type II toxin-antitoxin system RelE/ParE family toxin [archaeon]|nr:type II toxin-antitoxin system RelE/ParE family toxin [archaeon]
MKYHEILTKPFLNDVKSIKKDKILLERLHKKMDGILENPEHYPPKKYNLKNKRSAHIGSFVILFEIDDDKLIFLKFRHHDYVYG